MYAYRPYCKDSSREGTTDTSEESKSICEIRYDIDILRVDANYYYQNYWRQRKWNQLVFIPFIKQNMYSISWNFLE